MSGVRMRPRRLRMWDTATRRARFWTGCSWASLSGRYVFVWPTDVGCVHVRMMFPHTHLSPLCLKPPIPSAASPSPLGSLPHIHPATSSLQHPPPPFNSSTPTPTSSPPTISTTNTPTGRRPQAQILLPSQRLHRRQRRRLHRRRPLRHRPHRRSPRLRRIQVPPGAAGRAVKNPASFFPLYPPAISILGGC